MTSNPQEIGPELVRRARHGDREGLRELVEAAYPLVRRWTLVRSGDSAEADDLTQDVMIRMIRKLESFRGTARFSTWLYTLTRNVANEGTRRRARRATILRGARAVEALTPEAPPRPDEQAERGALGGVVRTFFEELPERQREVFDLVELQGLTSPEAAERLGIEAVSVRAHLFKARRTLRARILQSSPEWAEELG